MKFADRLAMLCDRAADDAAAVASLVPLVLEHSRRGGPNLPVGGRVRVSLSQPPTGVMLRTHPDDPLPVHSPRGDPSDPTGDLATALAMAPPQPEDLDKRALLMALDAFDRLATARKALTGQVRAQASAIAMGRPPTDGRTEAELVAEKERRRVTAADLDCSACEQPTGVRRAGMCDACYRSWNRAGRPDRGEWSARRRRELADRAKLEQRKGDDAA